MCSTRGGLYLGLAVRKLEQKAFVLFGGVFVIFFCVKRQIRLGCLGRIVGRVVWSAENKVTSREPCGPVAQKRKILDIAQHSKM